MSQAQEWILNWFEYNTYVSKQELIEKINENYFNAGFLDSFGFISFITAIEEYFNVTFDSTQLQQPQFSSIYGLSEIISRLPTDENVKCQLKTEVGGGHESEI